MEKMPEAINEVPDEIDVLKERVRAPLVEFAQEALDQYLTKNPNVAVKLFPHSNGKAAELKEKAVQDIANKVGIFMNRSRLSDIIENRETHEDGIALREDIAFEKAEEICNTLRMESKIKIDELTDLPNIKGYREHLKKEISRSDRDKRPLCLLIVDLDRFKSVNDTHGHKAGDQVLIEVARRLKAEEPSQKILRDSDFAARYAGDEMVFLLPNTNQEDACLVAHRISKAMRNQDFIVGTNGSSREITVTVSIGIAEFQGAEDDPIGDDMFEEADRNLYISKSRRDSISCDGEILENDDLEQLMKKRKPIQFPMNRIKQRTGQALEMVK